MKIITSYEKIKIALSRQGRLAAGDDEDRVQKVRQIINDVRARGDAAIFDYTEKFDGVKLTSLEVDEKLVNRAYREMDKELLAAMELAAARIIAYHEEQKKKLIKDSVKAKLGWLVRPLEKIGVYAPGFQAPLPSTVLMTALPAKVAGVKEIIMVTPPGRQGRVSPVTLAAAKIAGVSRVFSVGGAQAIAALAYGTESIPAVDKVCGPGNIWVTLAKRMVSGDVGIDGLYGPSEVIIIADATASAAYVAADLLAQAEHGSGPAAIMMTTSRDMATKVNREIARQLPMLSRRVVIDEALKRNSFIAIVASVNSAIELANLYAPEHLCLVVKDAASYVKKVKNAGCLFTGENSIEALVDYVAGPSHVLPTGGTARFGSGLNILDFIKIISLVKTNVTDIRQLGRAVSVIARAEGLDAHARAMEKRLEDAGQGGS